MGEKIYAAIVDVMRQVGAVSKDKTNSAQGFKYRGVDDLMNALNPALAKAGVFCVPELLESTREERVNAKGTALTFVTCKMKYTFYADDGSNVSAVVVGEGMDSGDKATNKAMSVAYKYAAFQTFCIPTEDMSDPDADSHTLSPSKKAAPPKASTTASSSATPDELTSTIKKIVECCNLKGGQKNATLMGYLKEKCPGGNPNKITTVQVANEVLDGIYKIPPMAS